MESVDRPNAQYNVATPASLPVKVATYARKRMYATFLSRTKIAAEESLLDVGVTSDQSYEASNYLEAWYPHKHRITAAGIDDASFLEQKYPGVRFRMADALNLPFESNSFDVVHSSAVIEHVGSFDRQRQYIYELFRVASRAVFFTTPNRWFPIEFHTVLPLIHWLPKKVFRSLIGRTKYRFFASEDNLNLMDAGELKELTSDLKNCSVQIESQRLVAIPSNLMVTIIKR